MPVLEVIVTSVLSTISTGHNHQCVHECLFSSSNKVVVFYKPEVVHEFIVIMAWSTDLLARFGTGLQALVNTLLPCSGFITMS